MQAMLIYSPSSDSVMQAMLIYSPLFDSVMQAMLIYSPSFDSVMQAMLIYSPSSDSVMQAMLIPFLLGPRLIIWQVGFQFPHCLMYILILVLVVRHVLLGESIVIEHAVGLVA